MTVKELIDVLSKIENQDLEVLVRGTDPTDFTYHNDIEGVEVDDVYDENLDEEKKFVVIDGGEF
jgi:hypothetical protein